MVKRWQGICFQFVLFLALDFLGWNLIGAWTTSRLNYISKQRLPATRSRTCPSTTTNAIDSCLFSTAAPESSTREKSGVSNKNDYKKRPRRNKGKKKPLNHSSIKYMFKSAKNMERQGRWAEASATYEKILARAPKDSYSHLALARLEARRELKPRIAGRTKNESSKSGNNNEERVISRAESAFSNGTSACPKSVHLWQAWAVYEESRGNFDRARGLFQQALTIEPYNSYVCHAYGLMEKKLGNESRATDLFQHALEEHSTAALVCSLGEILISNGNFQAARDLYGQKLPHLKKEKDQIEVYLASAWLEERYFHDFARAQELINVALKLSPGSSLANVALARLEGRMHRRSNNNGPSGDRATAKRLADVCKNIEEGTQRPSDPTGGRVFNALANIEVKAKRYKAAKEILRKGMELYPLDYMLFQAAGKLEERMGNFIAARKLYGESLRLQPSAPTLVAFAMLEIRRPDAKVANYTRVKGLFEEALLLDPRHGPAYNAYGNAEFERGNIDSAREIFERGVRAECSDAGSLYHGYGKFELSLGNVEVARSILEKGLEEVRMKDHGTDSTHRDRAKYLSHTLGMLELNSNRPAVALEIMQEGISRCGNSSRLLLGAALCEMKLGKEDAARQLFERSVMSDKRHAQAWQAWGVMETRAGNFKTAATLFQCGIRSAPNHGALWQGYAALELKKGNVQNSRILLAGGLQKAPNHVPLYTSWALLELNEGNYQASRKLITEALTRNKKNGDGWLIAARIEEEEGHDGLVSLILRRGIECAPNSAELYRKLGEYLLGTGKIDDAREVFETGINVNPMNALLYHSLAELEAQVFNLEGLARLNQRAAEVFNSNALEPAPSSSAAYGTKIKAKRTGKLPRGIAALANKIVDEDGDGSLLGIDGIDEMDPDSALESMTGKLMEDEYVGDLLSLD